MAEIQHPRKIGTKRRRTRSTRPRPSEELKQITPRFVSYAPSDVAARHPKAAKGLSIACFAILSALLLPVLDRWYLDWRTPERLIVDDLTSDFKYIENELCGHFQRGTLTVRALTECEGACSSMQTAQMINVARASDFVNIICFDKEASPERNVDVIFTAMEGGQ